MKNTSSELQNKLKIRLPVVQAPMAGGATTPKLVAKVSNMGGLGSLGAGYLSPSLIRDNIRLIRDLTDKPFSVNLFIPQLLDFKKNQAKIDKMNMKLNFYRAKLGIETQAAPPSNYEEIFSEQVAVLLEEKVPVFSFTFGLLSQDIIAQFKANNTIIMGTATTVAEAIAIEKQGCDIVVAQGSEAGGHRGTFLGSFRTSQIGTMALVPQVVDNVKIPVLASGGIMDGRSLIAALALGASGVQMGTAFLTCEESGFPPIYKKILLNSTEENTVVTNVFSGKPVRSIMNKFISDLEKNLDEIPDYPLQNLLTQAIRKQATAQGKIDLMSIWSGQGVRLCKSTSADQLVHDIEKQANETIESLKFFKFGN